MKLSFFAFFTFLFIFFQESTCKKSDKELQAYKEILSKDQFERLKASSSCIQKKVTLFIEEASLQPAGVYQFTSKGDRFYLFDEGMAVDGPGYILNEKCDTVCTTGGMRLLPEEERNKCPRQDENSREIIWQKQPY